VVSSGVLVKAIPDGENSTGCWQYRRRFALGNALGPGPGNRFRTLFPEFPILALIFP
jgi:hypothetical protein